MRRVVATFIAAGLLVACSGGSDDTNPVSSDESAAPTDPSPTDASPATVDVDPPEPDPAELPSVDELRLLARNGDRSAQREYALARFSAEFARIDGAIEATMDSSRPVSGSQTLHEIDLVWADLDLAVQTQIADALSRLRADSTLVGEGDQTGEPVRLGAVPAEDAPDPIDAGAADAADPADDAGLEPADDGAQPQGFASASLSALAALPAVIDEDEADSIAAAATSYLVARLGGSIRYDLYVAPASAARSRSIDGSTITTIYAPGSVLSDLLDDGGRPDCDIYIYDRPRMVGARLKSVIAHELFHCWTYVNSGTTGDHDALVPWFAEGVATWVGEQYAGGSSFGALWWPAYFDRELFPLYLTEYRALGFWSQVAQARGGAEALWDRIPTITAAAARGDASTYAAAMDGVPLERWAELASNAAREAGWGRDWDLTGPGITGDRRTAAPQAITGSTPIEQNAGPGKQLIVRFDIDPLLSEGPWIVDATHDGLVNVRFSDGTAYTTTTRDVRQWCLAGPCVCPDGSEPIPGLDDLPSNEVWVGLTGGTRTTSTTSLSVDSIEDACEREPLDPLPAPGAGLVGTWRANPNAVAGAFELASIFGDDDSPINVEGASGDVFMTFAENGTGTLKWTDVTLIMSEELIGAITLNGGGTFNWGGTAPNIEISGTSFAISVRAAAIGDELLTITDADVPAGGTTDLGATLAGDMLTVFAATGDEGAVFFPVSWVRQPDPDE